MIKTSGGQPSQYNIEPVSGILLAPRAQIDSSGPIDTRARNCLTFSKTQFGSILVYLQKRQNQF